VSLDDVFAAAVAPPAVVVIRCQRCRCLRVPARDPGLVLCRSCLAEVQELTDEPTGVGPVMGNA
jgi:hypothetical protein